MTNSQKLTQLKKKYGAEFKVAKSVAENQLFIGPSDDLYPYAIEWVILNMMDIEKDVLTKKETAIFNKDVKNKKSDGAVHKKIRSQIKVLKDRSKTLDGKQPISTSTLDQRISAAPSTLPVADPVKKEKPEVKLESNIKRVPKGGSVNLVWSSKNATKVRRTNIPGVTTKSPVNGSVDVDDIRRRRDFYIIVEGPGGSAESRITTLVETQAFLQGKEKEPVDVSQPDPTSRPDDTPRRPPVSLVSPSSRPQQQTRTSRPVTGGGDASSLNLGILTSIDKSLLNVSKILFNQLKLNQRAFDLDRRGRESEIRQGREEEMEADKGPSGGELMKKGAEKILSPFKAIIDKIVNFLFFTFLGRVFTDLVKWFNDPKNKGKVEALGRFIKDMWPIIVGAAVLVLTPLLGFVVGTVQFLIGTYKTLKGLKWLIDKLIFKKGAKKGPKTKISGSTAAKGAGEGILSAKKILETKKNLATDVLNKGLKAKGAIVNGKYISVTADEAASILAKKPGGVNLKSLSKLKSVKGVPGIALALAEIFQDPLQKGVGNIYEGLGIIKKGKAKENIEKSKQIFDPDYTPNLFKVGGSIFSGLVKETDGIKVSGAGADTQAFPIMGGRKEGIQGMAVLQPGEFVLNKRGVQNAIKLGIDPLELNTGPNANKPQKISGGSIKLMSTGGRVGNMMTHNASKKMSNRSMSPSSSSSPMISRGSSSNSSISSPMISRGSSMGSPSSSSSPMISRGSSSNSSISSPMISRGSSMGSPSSSSSPMMPRLFSTPQMSSYSPPKSGGMSQNLSFSSPTLATRTSNAFYSQTQESTTREYKTETPLIATEKIKIPSLNSITSSGSNFRMRSSQADMSPRPLSRPSNTAPIILPPITQGAGTVPSAPGSGTQLPTFPGTPAGLADVRMAMADNYGFV